MVRESIIAALAGLAIDAAACARHHPSAAAAPPEPVVVIVTNSTYLDVRHVQSARPLCARRESAAARRSNRQQRHVPD